MKRINWYARSWTITLVVFWLLVVWMLAGCAKPNYEMIHAIQQSMVQSNERIAQAIASAEHKMVEIKFEQDAYIPAGTTINTFYDWTHAVQFADTRYNPGVAVFQAEAQRDTAVVLGVVPPAVAGAVTAYGGYNSRKMTESIIKNVGGGVNITAAEDAQVTWTGDVGAREWGFQSGDTSGASYSTATDLSQNPVTTTTTTTDNSNQGNPINPDPVIVPAPDPIIVPSPDPIIVPSPDPIIVRPEIIRPEIVQPGGIF